jgi:hypothetical protein
VGRSGLRGVPRAEVRLRLAGGLIQSSAFRPPFERPYIQAPRGPRIGKLGVDVSAPVGLDIFSGTVGGVTVSNQGYASLSVGGAPRFYWVDLLIGAATFAGAFDDAVVDIALPLATE